MDIKGAEMSFSSMVYEYLRALKSEIFGQELTRVSGIPLRFIHGFLNKRQNLVEIFELRDVAYDESKDSLSPGFALNPANTSAVKCGTGLVARSRSITRAPGWAASQRATNASVSRLEAPFSPKMLVLSFTSVFIRTDLIFTRRIEKTKD